METRHQMRLHGPWKLHVVPVIGDQNSKQGDDENSAWLAPTVHRFKVPGTVSFKLVESFAESAVTLRFERSFGKPTGLDSDQSLYLAIESLTHDAQISLYAKGESRLVTSFELSKHQPQLDEPAVRLDVTRLLDERNRLVIEMTVDEPSLRDATHYLPTGIDGEVRLEIIADKLA